jgi:tRNA threonylcarbamoyladenosine biosynthesis protein TsaB
MIVLGFDTATPATAVGLRLTDGTTLRSYDQPEAGERPGHTTQSLALASELLAQAGIGWDALERIAVGVGPGTFTGLRVGIATARGLAQSLGIEVVGVSSLRVLAQAALQGPDSQTRRGVLAAIDARRGEVFAAAYDAQGELAPPRALPPEDLAAIPGNLEGRSRETLASDRFGGHSLDRSRVTHACGAGRFGDASGANVSPIGPRFGRHPRIDQDPRFDQHDWWAVGDGALRFRGYLEAIAVAVPVDTSPLHRVDARVLCELALSAPAGDLEGVLPDYSRRPDAEISLEGGAAGRKAGEPGPSILQSKNKGSKK